MKPSELQAGATGPREAPDDLPYSRSELADPPITVIEARAASESTCCWHNGRIKTDPIPSDVEGRVYFCGVGRQYWRYGKPGGGYLKLPSLKYPKKTV